MNTEGLNRWSRPEIQALMTAASDLLSFVESVFNIQT
jgi:hypothetical protein